MFVIPGLWAMLAFLYIRPQEAFESMRGLTYPMVLGVTALGYVLDLATGITRPPRMSLLLWVALAFFGWAMLTLAIGAPEMITESALYFVAPASLFMATPLGIQTLRGFGVVSKIMLALTMVIVLVAIHQGFAPRLCIADTATTSAPVEDSEGRVRQCRTRAD